jgi:hypothetical protein
MKKISLFILITFVISFFSFLGSPVKAAGATLFLSPGSGEYTVGKSFNVKVMINSGGGLGINASEGTIKYDNSLLQITRISKDGSIFSLWTTEPTFSNTAGTISFGGGSPGAYKGTAGTVFSVTFSPKKEGEASVNFTSGIILVPDGKGADIFSGFGQAKFTIKEAEVKEVVPVEKREDNKPKAEEKVTGGGLLPPIPEISSNTHSDDEVWYSNNDPEFSWKLLSDLTGTSFMVTDSPESNPGVSSDGVIDMKQYSDVEDGIWYFHVKYQNNSGWGKVAHKKFLVDVTPPKAFMVSVDTEGDATNPTPKIRFKTTDVTSGIDHYNIKIGNMSRDVNPAEVEKGYYEAEVLLPGEYEVEVLAIDKANNSATSSVHFIVDPLKAPIITSIPRILNKKDDLVIQGESFYKNITVKIYIAADGKEAKEFEVKTDDAGNWSFFHKRNLEEGVYEVWAKMIDDRGAQSLDSGTNILTVIAPSIVEAYGLFIILFMLMIIILLSLFIIYQRTSFINEKMRIRRETDEVRRKLSKIFAALREEVDELVELADKKPGLSESERRVKEKLQESLDISEEFISKEVEDIEKEIKLPKSKTMLK